MALRPALGSVLRCSARHRGRFRQHEPQRARRTNAFRVSRRGGAPCLFLEGQSQPPPLQHRRGHLGPPGRRAGPRGRPRARPRGRQLRSGPVLQRTTCLDPEASRTPSRRPWSRPLGGRCRRGPRRAGMTGGPGSRRPGRPARARAQGARTARSAAPRAAPAGHARAPGSPPETTAKPQPWRPGPTAGCQGPTAAPTHTHGDGDAQHESRNRPRAACNKNFLKTSLCRVLFP